MNYNQRIRDLREDADLKQENIAKLLDTSQTVYSRYERGERELPINHLIKLCIFYDISPEYVLCFTNEPKPLPKK